MGSSDGSADAGQIPHLTLSRESASPGDPVELSWNIDNFDAGPISVVLSVAPDDGHDGTDVTGQGASGSLSISAPGSAGSYRYALTVTPQDGSKTHHSHRVLEVRAAAPPPETTTATPAPPETTTATPAPPETTTAKPDTPVTTTTVETLSTTTTAPAAATTTAPATTTTTPPATTTTTAPAATTTTAPAATTTSSPAATTTSSPATTTTVEMLSSVGIASFDAVENPITAGEQIKLTWSFDDATASLLAAHKATVALDDSVNPAVDVTNHVMPYWVPGPAEVGKPTFKLTVTADDGGEDSRSLNVEVVEDLSALSVASFTVDETQPLTNAYVTFEWAFDDATAKAMSGGTITLEQLGGTDPGTGMEVGGGLDVSGRTHVHTRVGSTPGEEQYQLTITAADGRTASSDVLKLEVIEDLSGLPVSPPADVHAPPHIDDFTADKTSYQAGDEPYLRWTLSGGSVTSITVMGPDGMQELDPGDRQTNVKVTQSVEVTLRVAGEGGDDSSVLPLQVKLPETSDNSFDLGSVEVPIVEKTDSEALGPISRVGYSIGLYLNGTITRADTPDNAGWQPIMDVLGGKLQARFGSPMAEFLANLKNAQAHGDWFKKIAVESTNNSGFAVGTQSIATITVDTPQLAAEGFSPITIDVSVTFLSATTKGDVDAQLITLTESGEAVLLELDVAGEEPVHWEGQLKASLKAAVNTSAFSLKSALETWAKDLVLKAGEAIGEELLAAAAPIIGGIVGSLVLIIWLENVLYGDVGQFVTIDDRLEKSVKSFGAGFKAGLCGSDQPDGDSDYETEAAKNGYASGQQTRDRVKEGWRDNPPSAIAGVMADDRLPYDAAFDRVGLEPAAVDKLTGQAESVHRPLARYDLATDFVKNHTGDPVTNACGADIVMQWYVGEGWYNPFDGDTSYQVITPKGWSRVPEGPLRDFFLSLTPRGRKEGVWGDRPPIQGVDRDCPACDI